MDPLASAASLLSAQHGIARLDALMSMAGKQARSEQSQVVGLLEQAVEAAKESLPSPAPGKGLVVDVQV